ncbi:hypothetical protein DIE04_26490 [Burkholderia sp. Bp8994]|nr:hypothetical protein DIE20_30565 [Burkholderia sp. Bp9131]RQR67435.1 hypothetical protein DIE12_29340 [Burkholderia sp. Bp9015]RQR91255.1 hypothetical protein DIE04_26490 [Burkholderia sp. Bp8994]RQS31233.1 hypothetical protein DIE05_08345 [Burkholderia sp. Bp8995]RQS34225.1 hypothetical protein DIE01_29035 [Burkholderia sp. Bp8990]RQS49122.1 hypothetical protein DIE00_08900 [Burkholderia sp. Bp8989]RQZ46481.1 hypothetical protein DIE17_18195 [Burkholderia sp. Bp9099]
MCVLGRARGVGRRRPGLRLDGSIFSRGDEKVFSHLARMTPEREKLRRFRSEIERFFARGGGRLFGACRGGQAGCLEKAGMRGRRAAGAAAGARRPCGKGSGGGTGEPSPIECTAFGLIAGAGCPQCRGCVSGWPARSPFGCTGFRVAPEAGCPHLDRSAVRADADAHRRNSQRGESMLAGDIHTVGFLPRRRGVRPHLWDAQVCESIRQRDIHTAVRPRDVSERPGDAGQRASVWMGPPPQAPARPWRSSAHAVASPDEVPARVWISPTPGAENPVNFDDEHRHAIAQGCRSGCGQPNPRRLETLCISTVSAGTRSNESADPDANSPPHDNAKRRDLQR